MTLTRQYRPKPYVKQATKARATFDRDQADKKNLVNFFDRFSQSRYKTSFILSASVSLARRKQAIVIEPVFLTVCCC